MKTNHYRNIGISLAIILFGIYNFGNINTNENINFWLKNVILFAFFFIAGMFLLNFNLKNLPKKNYKTLNRNLIFPILIGVIGLFLVNYFFPILLIKLCNLNIGQEKNNYIEISKFIPFMIIMVIIEELIFRRIISQMIFNEKGFRKSLWISAFAFTIAHLFSDTGLLNIFIGGLFLTYIYLKTENIYLCIIIHLFYNLLNYFGRDILIENVNYYDSYSKILIIILIGFTFIIVTKYYVEKQNLKKVE